MTQVDLHKRRIIIIDDNDSIHRDFRKILAAPLAAADAVLAAEEAAIFGDAALPVGGDRPAYEIDFAFQGQEGFEKVRQAQALGRPYSLAFVDMRMPPGWDGIETIRHLWEVDPDLQIVVCTAFTDYSWDQIVEKLGATDRLLILKKPFDGMEVCQFATALTEKWHLKRKASLKMEELEAMVRERTAELQNLALRDKLTGLPNRVFFNEHLSHAVARARRNPDYKFAVLFLDFDRFKVVNDSLGHEVGDLLLIEIARRLRESLRHNDVIAQPDAASTAARLGGDEFVVLLDSIHDARDAVRVTERLLTLLAVPYKLKGHEVHTTVSIGITSSDCGYQCAEDVLRDADTAMYRAKAAGKARYALFDRTMHDEAVARLAIENELRSALDQRQFTLHYQPIVHLDTGRLAGFEALVRWEHPQRGMIVPNDFIPIAEETGLILSLGSWVLDEACRQLKIWRDKFPQFPDLSISVNVSRKQIAAPTLLSHIQRTISRHGVDPAGLIIEITESSMMDNPDSCVQVLQQIRQMGVRLHIDDFGTGYSSLSCLHRFPLNGLKVDRAFLKNVNERREYAAIVQAIITLARNLDMRVIAEGVETADQVAMLLALECDHAQGYLFGRPVAAAQAETFLRQSLSEAPSDVHAGP